MGTTIFPIPSGSPFDDDGPSFPTSAGQGMGFEQTTRLRESVRGKKTPKQIIKEAEGVLNPSHSKPKKKQMGGKVKNLRTSDRKKKRGPFGESYAAASGGKGKGVRVAESRGGANQRMYEALVKKFVKMGSTRKRAHREAKDFLERTA